jgi:hypothetical protein
VGTALPAGTTPVLPGTRDGARREILAAIRAVLARSGTTTFTPTQVVTEMTRRGTGYAESTMRTMITAHMCRNAPDNASTTFRNATSPKVARRRFAGGPSVRTSASA